MCRRLILIPCPNDRKDRLTGQSVKVVLRTIRSAYVSISQVHATLRQDQFHTDLGRSLIQIVVGPAALAAYGIDR